MRKPDKELNEFSISNFPNPLSFYTSCFPRSHYLYNELNSKLVDVDECDSSELNECSPNAVCNNTEGSYICNCVRGFEGDGKNCTGRKMHLLVSP